jgi:hypothetical protein
MEPTMTISEVLREAQSEHEILFLLAAYVEAVRYCDPLHHLPAFMTELPFTGLQDVWTRAERMQAVMESPEGADSGIRAVLAEALDILSAAGKRLEALRDDQASHMLEAA